MYHCKIVYWLVYTQYVLLNEPLIKKTYIIPNCMAIEVIYLYS